MIDIGTRTQITRLIPNGQGAYIPDGWSTSYIGGSQYPPPDGFYRVFFDRCQILEVNMDRGDDTDKVVFQDSISSEMTVLVRIDDFSDIYWKSGGTESGVFLKTDTQVQFWIDNTPLYTGSVKDIDAEFALDGTATVTITCNDEFEKLTDNPFDYALTTQSWLWDAHLLNVLRDKTSIDSNGLEVFTPTEQIRVEPLPDGQLARDHVAWTINTVGGKVFQKADGTFRAFDWAHWDRARGNRPIEIEFSDVHDDNNAKHSCYSGIDVRYSSSDTWTAIKGTSYWATAGGDLGSTTAIANFSDTETVLDIELMYYLGEGGSAGYPGMLMVHLQELEFNTQNRLPLRVNNLVFQPENVAQCAIELGDWVSVQYGTNLPEVNRDYMVTGISHSIDADSWDITLKLYVGTI